MTVTADLIASLVHEQYDQLPPKRKPAVRDNGLHEWVPLSGIVAEGRDGKLQCISLATGMKCLPSAKLSQAQGNILHDWHAEVLAIRAFNRFVLDECKALLLAQAQGGATTSEFLRLRTEQEMAMAGSSSEADWHGQPFTWREDVLLHMYCSEAPCGDASMELTMASQDDATPWTVPPPSQAPPAAAALLPGRAYFSALGIVRRKPSRGDAPATLSKSCSDKLALRQCVSLLSSAASLLVSPAHAYASTLVLPASQHAAPACERAFSPRGRMGRAAAAAADDSGSSSSSSSSSTWPGGYSFRPFAVQTTGSEFAFSRRQRAAAGYRDPPPKLTSSNLAVAWTLRPAAGGVSVSGCEEATLSGVLQGRRPADGARGASFASRRRLWGLAAEIAGLLPSQSQIRSALGPAPRQRKPKPKPKPKPKAKPRGEEAEQDPLPPPHAAAATVTYGDLKSAPLLGPRRRVKEEVRREALAGWARNVGDEDFVL